MTGILRVDQIYIHPWALSRLWPGTPGKEPPRLKGPVAPEVFEQAARSGKVGGGWRGAEKGTLSG